MSSSILLTVSWQNMDWNEITVWDFAQMAHRPWQEKDRTAQRTHCIIHREALASRQLSPELNEVLTEVICVVNFIKIWTLSVHLFSALCEEMGAEHSAVLQRGKVALTRKDVIASLWTQRGDLGVLGGEHVWSCKQIQWWTVPDESQWWIWEAEWMKSSVSRQRQASTWPGRQDQCIHWKAGGVGQALWSRKYWLLWECDRIHWEQWLWSHHSDPISSSTSLPWEDFSRNTSQTTVFSMTGWWIHSMQQHLLISALLNKNNSLRWHLTPPWSWRFKVQTLSAFWLGVERDHVKWS